MNNLKRDLWDACWDACEADNAESLIRIKANPANKMEVALMANAPRCIQTLLDRHPNQVEAKLKTEDVLSDLYEVETRATHRKTKALAALLNTGKITQKAIQLGAVRHAWTQSGRRATQAETLLRGAGATDADFRLGRTIRNHSQTKRYPSGSFAWIPTNHPGILWLCQRDCMEGGHHIPTLLERYPNMPQKGLDNLVESAIRLSCPVAAEALTKRGATSIHLAELRVGRALQANDTDSAEFQWGLCQDKALAIQEAIQASPTEKEAIGFLLDKGMNPNAAGPFHFSSTLLERVAKAGKLESLRLLKNRGGVPRQRTFLGSLIDTVAAGHQECAEELAACRKTPLSEEERNYLSFRSYTLPETTKHQLHKILAALNRP